MSWSDPQPVQADDLIMVADWNQNVVDNPQHLHDNFPERATIWAGEGTVAAGCGGSLNIGPTSTQAYCVRASQATAGNGDEVTWSFVLKGGTCTLSVLGGTFNAAGRLDWSIDGQTVISGQDWYSATGVDNVIRSESVMVTGTGRHLLRLTVNGKNAASSGYGFRLTAIWLKPSTDTQGV